MTWSEAQIARERINKQIAMEAVAIQAAVTSVVGGGEEFNKMIGRLNGN